MGHLAHKFFKITIFKEIETLIFKEIETLIFKEIETLIFKEIETLIVEHKKLTNFCLQDHKRSIINRAIIFLKSLRQKKNVFLEPMDIQKSG